jgi:hypothetical protein
VRAARGNDISKENPSFDAGVAGAGGFIRWLESGLPDPLANPVVLPIGSFVMVGSSQMRLA